MNMPHQGRSLDVFKKQLLTLLLAPVPFEVAVGIVKRESYDFRRLGIIVAALLVLSFLVATMRRRTWWYPQVLVGYYVLIIGAMMTAFGLYAAIWSDEIRAMTGWSGEVEVTVSSLTPTLGALLVISGVYLIRDRLLRVKAELDDPPPADISIGVMEPLEMHTSVMWKSSAIPLEGREALIPVCQRFLDTNDLHYVAFYNVGGDCYFYVDLFSDKELALRALGDTSTRRVNYVRHARHLRHLITKLNGRYSDLRTGKLVRVIMDVEQGAIYYYDLGAEGFLIGVTLDQTQVDPTDWKMSILANTVLKRLGHRPDDDFHRLCPQCGATSRDVELLLPGKAGGSNVVPIQRPKDGTSDHA